MMWLAITGVTVMTFGFWCFANVLASAGRRSVQRMRGIRMESVREGSRFERAEIPDNQVAVRIPGTFTDEHIGYGVRFADYLVVPRHVLELSVQGKLRENVLLVGKNGKLIVTINATQSRGCSDLVYVNLSAKTWSILGAPHIKWANESKNVQVTCTGMPGQSNGRIRKTRQEWMVSYEGSTLPGMSGAAYMNENLVMGVHQGATGAFNMGFSSELVTAEMSLLLRNEDTGDTNVEPKQSRYLSAVQDQSFGKNFYDRIAALDRLEKKYGAGSDWNLDGAANYDQQFDFESRPRPGVSNSSRPVRVAVPQGGVQLVNHNQTGRTTLIEVQHQDMLDAFANARVLDRLAVLERAVGELRAQQPPLENDRLVALEQAVRDLKPREMPVVMERAQPSYAEVAKTAPSEKKPRKKYACKLCNIVTRTQMRLDNHIASNHKTGQVQMESAIPSDTGKSGKIIKMGSFLEKRSSSPRNKSNQSSRSSRFSEKKNHSPLPEGSLSEMIASQRSISADLKELLKVMVGQSSAMTQKCGVSPTTQC
ncbi:hypothetical protein 1 [Sanxia sobemo-like virus 4]|uniref:hypothetical protein 1 n=1 Tax=Sanxia sobemo-like virus 4 TaxID=1923383 RepID=UPI0009098E84|nr:hypothetical protein 1 [Sanxia sobemo-like virus 4]APG75863.1 hypothetical protein 1 [Sanxia sobemo-like virus 4]